MENKKIYNDDVERIVNDPKRKKAINAFHEKKQAERQKKMYMDAVVYLTISLVAGMLGLFGWMTEWIAFPLCGVCGLYSAFCFGRFFENLKCWGWH